MSFGATDFRRRGWMPPRPTADNPRRRFNRGGVSWWWNGSVWVPLPKNPYAANTVFLCHGDELAAYGPTQRGTGPVISMTGTTLSTLQSKFHHASILNDSNSVVGASTFKMTTQYFASESNAAYNFGSGDFSFGFWHRPTLVGTITLWDQGYTNNTRPYIYTDSSGRIYYYEASTNRITSSTGVIVANNWYWIEYNRYGTTGELTVNGTSIGTWTDNITYTQGGIAVGGTLPISSVSGSITPGNGYYEDIIAVKGVAMHQGSFTPPTMPFSDY